MEGYPGGPHSSRVHVDAPGCAAQGAPAVRSTLYGRIAAAADRVRATKNVRRSRSTVCSRAKWGRLERNLSRSRPEHAEQTRDLPREPRAITITIWRDLTAEHAGHGRGRFCVNQPR